MKNIGFQFEPSVWLGVIRAIVVAGSHFGLQLSGDQTAAIYLVAESISTLIQRSVVTPVAEKSSSVTVTRTESTPTTPPTEGRG